MVANGSPMNARARQTLQIAVHFGSGPTTSRYHFLARAPLHANGSHFRGIGATTFLASWPDCATQNSKDERDAAKGVYHRRARRYHRPRRERVCEVVGEISEATPRSYTQLV